MHYCIVSVTNLGLPAAVAKLAHRAKSGVVFYDKLHDKLVISSLSRLQCFGFVRQPVAAFKLQPSGC